MAQLILDTLAVTLRKKNEIVREIFSPALEMQFARVIEISGNLMSKYKTSLTKIEIFYIFALLNGRKCQERYQVITKKDVRLNEELPKTLIAIKHLRNTLESPSFFLQKSTVDSKMSMLVISLN